MKNLFYMLIFTFFSTTVYAQTAAETACRKVMRPPEIEISASYGKLKYDFSKNNRTLTRMHLRQYGGNVPTGKFVHGLATHDLTTEINFKLRKNTLPSGFVCVYPANIELKIGIKNPTIYISKDLKEGSCLYQIAMRHEQTHQQINTEALEHYLPLLQKRFLAAVKKNALLSSRSDINLTLAQDKFKDKYLQALNLVLDEIETEVNTEQAKLDSEENYEYEASLCR